MSDEAGVLAASTQFYAALNAMLSGDASGMADIWSQTATVTTMHPIGGRQVGWADVKASWDAVAKIAGGGEVVVEERIIQVAGDMAYELGIEQGHVMIAGHEVPKIDDRVTNVYRREGGTWKIVHHHTDISEAMLEVLAEFQEGE